MTKADRSLTAPQIHARAVHGARQLRGTTPAPKPVNGAGLDLAAVQTALSNLSAEIHSQGSRDKIRQYLEETGHALRRAIERQARRDQLRRNAYKRQEP